MKTTLKTILALTMLTASLQAEQNYTFVTVGAWPLCAGSVIPQNSFVWAGYVPGTETYGVILVPKNPDTKVFRYTVSGTVNGQFVSTSALIEYDPRGTMPV